MQSGFSDLLWVYIIRILVTPPLWVTLVSLVTQFSAVAAFYKVPKESFLVWLSEQFFVVVCGKLSQLSHCPGFGSHHWNYGFTLCYFLESPVLLLFLVEPLIPDTWWSGFCSLFSPPKFASVGLVVLPGWAVFSNCLSKPLRSQKYHQLGNFASPRLTHV